MLSARIIMGIHHWWVTLFPRHFFFVSANNLWKSLSIKLFESTFPPIDVVVCERSYGNGYNVVQVEFECSEGEKSSKANTNLGSHRKWVNVLCISNFVRDFALKKTPQIMSTEFRPVISAWASSFCASSPKQKPYCSRVRVICRPMFCSKLKNSMTMTNMLAQSYRNWRSVNALRLHNHCFNQANIWTRRPYHQNLWSRRRAAAAMMVFSCDLMPYQRKARHCPHHRAIRRP